MEREIYSSAQHMECFGDVKLIIAEFDIADWLKMVEVLDK